MLDIFIFEKEVGGIYSMMWMILLYIRYISQIIGHKK